MDPQYFSNQVYRQLFNTFRQVIVGVFLLMAGTLTGIAPSALGQACCSNSQTLANWNFENAECCDAGILGSGIPPTTSSSCNSVGRLFSTGNIMNSLLNSGKGESVYTTKKAICVGQFNQSSWSTTGQTIYFEVTFPAGKCGKLDAFSFAEQVLNKTGNGGHRDNPILNDYPQNFGVAVLRNGSKIYERSGLSTNLGSWKLETFSFSGSNFITDGSAAVTFRIIIGAYNPKANGTPDNKQVWELDEFTLTGCCQNATAPPACAINNLGTSTVCRDNGNTNASDDYFLLTLNPSGTGLGSNYNYTINPGNVTGSGTYGTAKQLSNNFPMGTNLSVTITDQSNSACTLSGTVNSPSPCTPACTAPSLDAPTITCSGSTATVTLSASGGSSGTKEYKVDNGSWQTSATFTGIADGLHTAYVRIQGTSNCQNSRTFSTNCSSANCTLNLTASPSACNPASNQYSVSGSLTFSGAPATGQLIVSDGVVNQTFNAPFTSPLTYTLNGLGAGSGAHTVTAYFSAAAGCAGSAGYTAPASCQSSPCSLNVTATPSACNNTNNQYSVSGTLTLTNPPSSGQLIVSDGGATQTFNAPFGSSLSYTLSGLSAGSGGHVVQAYFTANGGCSDAQGYTAPATCQIIPCAMQMTINTVGSCNPANNFYSLSGTLTLTSPPATGQLVISDGSSIITLNAPFGSGVTFTFNGLPSGSGARTVQAYFTADATCTASRSYTAPVACMPPPCALTMIPPIPSFCSPATGLFDVSGVLSFTNAPSSGSLIITAGGVSRTFTSPFTSPFSFTLTGLRADGIGRSVIAQFTTGGCAAYSPYPTPAPCPCSMNPPVVQTFCNDRGTGTSNDDTYTFTINASGVNTAPTYVITGAVSGTGTYLSPTSQFGTFTITSGPRTVTLTDANSPGCRYVATVQPPAPCSVLKADVVVTKLASATTVTHGQSVTYTVRVTNNGPDAATGLVIKDMLPAGVTYVSDDSASTSTSYSSGTGLWTVGTLANGAFKELKITVTVI